VLNTLSNTPCFLPSGSGPRRDELYWLYQPSLDADRTSSIISSSPSPTSPSINTLVNAHLYPLKEEGDTWVEIDLAQVTENEQEKVHSTLRKKHDKHAKRTMRKEKEVRTEEWTRQTHCQKLHKSQPLPGSDEDEEPKPDTKPNVPGKILKPNRPQPQPENLAPVPVKSSTKLKKMEGKNDKACCIIA
jgi:hypothetical protein